MLQLVRETRKIPTTDAVAERAGVSRRSVFRHFADVSDLLTAAYDLQREDMLERYPRSDLSSSSQSDRIAAFTERTGQIFDYIAPVRQAAIEMSADYPILLQLMAADDAQQRKLVNEAFGPFMPANDKPQAELVMAALVASTSWATWNGMRSGQDLPYEQALETMRTMVRGSLLISSK